MKRRLVVGGIAALVLGLTTAVRAQTRVEGGVVIQSGPVTGQVEVGSPAREVIVVEHIHRRHGRGHGWWKKHGYRVVTVYYDGSRYYGRPMRRPGVRAVVVYERRGRYYRGDEYGERHRHDRHHRHDHDHDHDDDDDDDEDDD